MNRVKGLKEQIIKLRNQGWSYKEIASSLECSKATICYHCQKQGLTNVGLQRENLKEEEIKKVKTYYLSNSLNDTATHFNVSISTVKRYAKKEKVVLTVGEKKKKNYDRVKTHRQKIKGKAIAYKGGKCEKCDYNKCEWALEFHHTNPEEKDFIIAKYATLSWEKIKKELDKCIMVCANCHREIHHEIYRHVSSQS